MGSCSGVSPSTDENGAVTEACCYVHIIEYFARCGELMLLQLVSITYRCLSKAPNVCASLFFRAGSLMSWICDKPTRETLMNALLHFFFLPPFSLPSLYLYGCNMTTTRHTYKKRKKKQSTDCPLAISLFFFFSYSRPYVTDARNFFFASCPRIPKTR